MFQPIIGSIIHFASVDRIHGGYQNSYIECDGNLLERATNKLLDSVLGFQFGGSNQSVAIPDIAPISATNGSGVRSYMCIGGFGFQPNVPGVVGTLGAWPGQAFNTWLPCTGQTYSNTDQPKLYSVIGERFGGNANSFRTPTVAPLLTTKSQPIPRIIAAKGTLISPNSPSGSDPDALIGQVVLWAGTYSPAGWIRCDGRTLRIDDANELLYKTIGVKYGGNGATTFAVPNIPTVLAGDGINQLAYFICTNGIYAGP